MVIGMRSAGLGAVLIGCLVAAACSAGNVESGPLEDLPDLFRIGVIPAIATLGEGVVVAEEGSGDGTSTALVAPSGQVTMLPEAPAMANRALGAAGSSVALVGVTCSQCADPELVAFMLSSDRGQWTPLEVPAVELPRDSMVEFVGATDQVALFGTAAGVVSVSGAGVVERVPVEPTTLAEQSWMCVSPRQETLYRLVAPLRGSEGGSPGVFIGSIQYGTPTVSSLSLANTGAAWVNEPAPPTPSPVDSVQLLCTADSVLVLADGSEYELSDGEWIVTSAVPVLADLGDDSLSAVTAAISSDGSVTAVSMNQSQVVRRSAGGEWSVTGVEGTAAAGAVSGVFVADGRTNTVHFVPSE